MLKKTVAAILTGLLLIYFPSCYSKQVVTYPDIKNENLTKVEKVVTKSGDFYKMESAEVIGDYIVGSSAKFDYIVISKIESLKVILLDGTSQQIEPDELNNYQNKISKVFVKLKTGEETEYVKAQLVYPFYLKGKKITGPKIRIDDIQAALIEKKDDAKTAVGIFGGLGFVMFTCGIIALATKESCPFIYSFDGAKYVFDGEPYGGSICKALKRTDLSKLDYLAPIKGEYKLLLTNEVNEIQYTDQFRLLVVDHPADSEVIQDAFNNLYAINSRLKPVKIADGKGSNLYKPMEEKDRVVWQSDLGNKNPEIASDLRDDIYVTFKKPEGATKAKLIVHGCTTLWGSYMLKIISELHGKDVTKWYDDFKNPINLLRLNLWIDRTETYRLGVYVKSNNGWQRKGGIFGGGPFITEERIVPIDISDIRGTELEIKISPPAGFWQFDSFNIDYSEDLPVEVQEISANSIYDNDEADITSILENIDCDYYAMPFKGQKAVLTFPVPEPIPGMKRTVFAKVNGYYDIYLDASGEPQTEILKEIENNPDFIIKYSLLKNAEMRK
jgi:hypothetical protein